MIFFCLYTQADNKRTPQKTVCNNFELIHAVCGKIGIMDLIFLFLSSGTIPPLCLIFLWLWATSQAGRQHKQMHLLSICKWQWRDWCGEQVGHSVPTMLFAQDQHLPLLLEGILSHSYVSISQMAEMLNVNLLLEEKSGARAAPATAPGSTWRRSDRGSWHLSHACD